MTTLDFATEDNYLTGPEAGNPTKLDPPPGFLAEGFKPDEEPPAQYMNALMHALFADLRAFRAHVRPPLDLIRPVDTTGDAPIDPSFITSKSVIGFGVKWPYISRRGGAGYLRSRNGVDWVQPGNSPVGDVRSIAQGLNGRAVTVGNGGASSFANTPQFTINDDPPWLAVPTPHTDDLLSVVWHHNPAGASQFVAVGENGKIQVGASPNAGGWTLDLDIGGEDMTKVVSGGGRLVAIHDSGIVYSLDDGASWSNVFSITGGTANANYTDLLYVKNEDIPSGGTWFARSIFGLWVRSFDAVAWEDITASVVLLDVDGSGFPMSAGSAASNISTVATPAPPSQLATDSMFLYGRLDGFSGNSQGVWSRDGVTWYPGPVLSTTNAGFTSYIAVEGVTGFVEGPGGRTPSVRHPSQSPLIP